jgi:hypothetical protein
MRRGAKIRPGGQEQGGSRGHPPARQPIRRTSGRHVHRDSCRAPAGPLRAAQEALTLWLRLGTALASPPLAALPPSVMVPIAVSIGGSCASWSRVRASSTRMMPSPGAGGCVARSSSCYVAGRGRAGRARVDAQGYCEGGQPARLSLTTTRARPAPPRPATRQHASLQGVESLPYIGQRLSPAAPRPAPCCGSC